MFYSAYPHRKDSTIPLEISEAALNFASSGDNTIVSASSGKIVRIFRIFFVVAGDVNVKMKDGAGTDLTAAMTMKTGGSFVLDYDSFPWFSTVAGNAFLINLSGAVQVSGRIYYTQ